MYKLTRKKIIMAENKFNCNKWREIVRGILQRNYNKSDGDSIEVTSAVEMVIDEGDKAQKEYVADLFKVETLTKVIYNYGDIFIRNDVEYQLVKVIVRGHSYSGLLNLETNTVIDLVENNRENIPRSYFKYFSRYQEYTPKVYLKSEEEE